MFAATTIQQLLRGKKKFNNNEQEYLNLVLRTSLNNLLIPHLFLSNYVLLKTVVLYGVSENDFLF